MYAARGTVTIAALAAGRLRSAGFPMSDPRRQHAGQVSEAPQLKSPYSMSSTRDSLNSEPAGRAHGTPRSGAAPLDHVGPLSSLAHRYLDPATTLAEILFGLIMTLTFTLGAGLIIEDEGRAG